MFTTVINKMLFYFYKDHSSPMKTSVSMAYICVLKGLGQNNTCMYNYHYKNKTTDIYRYPEVASILSHTAELYMYKESVTDLFFIHFINLHC